jgi:hypothetical protein
MASARLSPGRKLFLAKRRFLAITTLLFALPIWVLAIWVFRTKQHGAPFVLFAALLCLVGGFGYALGMWWYFKPLRERMQASAGGASGASDDA